MCWLVVGALCFLGGIASVSWGTRDGSDDAFTFFGLMGTLIGVVLLAIAAAHLLNPTYHGIAGVL